METRYKKIEGKRHVWYVPLNDNAWQNLHVKRRLDSNGYAGRYIEFRMYDGTIERVKGPYHVAGMYSYDQRSFIDDTGMTLDDVIVEHQLLEGEI